MAVFKFKEEASIGTVFSVDTATLIIKVEEIEKLRKLAGKSFGGNQKFKSRTTSNWNYQSYYPKSF